MAGAGLRLRCLRTISSTCSVPLAASISCRCTSCARCSSVTVNCSTLASSRRDRRATNGLFVFFQLRLDRPVLARLESLDFLFAFDDQSQRGALHAPGRQTTADLLPQQRREIESHQIVQGAPRLLGIYEIHG